MIARGSLFMAAVRHKMGSLEVFPDPGDVLLLVECYAELRFLQHRAFLGQVVKVAAVGPVVSAQPDALGSLNRIQGASERQRTSSVHGNFDLCLDDFSTDWRGGARGGSRSRSHLEAR